MNHEIKDIVSDALGEQRERHKRQLAEALGYAAQTDAQEGLLDEHVELAIRMMSWDGKTIPPSEAA